jgi:hypothetical protein
MSVADFESAALIRRLMIEEKPVFSLVPPTPNLGEIMTRTIVVSISLLLVITITPSLLSNASLMPRTASLSQRSSGRSAAAAYGKLPVSFEPNLGQSDRRVKFLSRGPGYALFLTPTEAVLTLHKRANDSRSAGFHGPSTDFRLAAGVAQKMKSRLDEPETSSVLRIKLIDANCKPTLDGINPLPGTVNYFTAKNPAKWRRNIPTFSRVKYQQVYPGVDLVYYGNQRQLEYDFVVAPGADPHQIELSFNGANRLRLDADGNLIVSIAGGEVVEHKPVIYQDIGGMRRTIRGDYQVRNKHAVGFKLARYDDHQRLTIDPSLIYSTYLGDSGTNADGIALDSSGNVTGQAFSTDFPTTEGAFSTTPAGGYDAFVSKLNSTGSALVYSTYLGGTDYEEGLGIAVDSSGNAFVSGYTDSADFPVTAGAFQTRHGGNFDAFVTKLNSTGSALLYSTYLGGTSYEEVGAIAVDSSGNAYITGLTESNDFPTTEGAFQTKFVGTATNLFHAFVTKLNSTGSALLYSTYLGGTSYDGGAGIAVDSSNNAYVTGTTVSNDFPTTKNAFQTTFAGGGDVFVSKLNTTGSALLYSTYLGGNDIDAGVGIAVDLSGNAYVTGQTYSSDFPVTAGAFQTTFAGEKDVRDAFVTKMNSSGSALLYSSYLGGSGDDVGDGITLDSSGNAYVTGDTQSTDFPVTAGAFQTTNGGVEDAFVTKLNSTGSALLYSTYLGSSRFDAGVGIAVDLSGNAFVQGDTTSDDFPTTEGVLQSSSGGTFVSKLALMTFAGQPGKANCHGKSVSALAQKYGGMDSAAAALGFPSVKSLQDAIKAFCGG